ncbi:MAG: hypothetical protein ACE5HZ_08640 [Fidelibacterota bacterium]
MPRLSVWFVRASLVYLIVGFTFGSMMLVYKVQPLHPLLWWVRPSHIDFLLFGWTLQLAMGVAFWILPRFQGSARRGNVPLAWTAFFLINAGTLVAGLVPVVPLPPWTFLTGRTLEFAAVLAFAIHAFPRVKPFRETREGKP